MRKTTQKARILRHLQTHKRGLNPLYAWQKYGVYRLSDVILRLRRDGYEIATDIEEVVNQFGEKCKVAAYRLEK